MDTSTSREHLLTCARKVFSKQGFEGTTIKDIATSAQMNVSMVSYYFNGKEGLYSEILKRFSSERLEVAKEILQGPKSLEDAKVRLKLHAEQVIKCHFENKEMVRILLREINSENDKVAEIFDENFGSLFRVLIAFFENGQKNGVFKKHHDPFIVASLYFGSIHNMLTMDHLRKRKYKKTLEDETFRNQVIQNVTNMVLVGLAEVNE